LPEPYRLDPAIKNADKFYNLIDKLPKGPVFQKQTVTVNEVPEVAHLNYDFYYRNILELAEYQLQNPPSAETISYTAETLMDGDADVRLFGEMRSADEFHTQQVMKLTRSVYP